MLRSSLSLSACTIMLVSGTGIQRNAVTAWSGHLWRRRLCHHPVVSLAFEFAFRGRLRMVWGDVGHRAGIQAPVNVRVAQNNLDVSSSFVKRHRFDEFRRFAKRAPSAP